MRLPSDEAGSGPAVVLLHAGVADRTMFAEHLEPLAAAGRRAIALDLPGFGEAAPQAGPSAPWNDVLETLRALGVDRATLVGVSFGGAVALRVAVTAPAALERLVLVSAPAPVLEPSDELRAAWAEEEAALEGDDVEAAIDAVVRAWTLPDAPEALRERVAAMQRRAFALQRDAPEATEAPDPLDEHPELLQGLDLPTVVAVGARDKPDFLASAESLAAALPRAEHVVIPGAGHLAPLETPEAFRALVL